MRLLWLVFVEGLSLESRAECCGDIESDTGLGTALSMPLLNCLEFLWLLAAIGLIPCSPDEAVPNPGLCWRLWGLTVLLKRLLFSTGEYGGTGDADLSLTAASAAFAKKPWFSSSAGRLASFLERTDALCPLSAPVSKYLGDTGAAGISTGVSPDISNRLTEASAGTSVGCRLSPRSSENDVFDCGARCNRAKKLRPTGFSEAAASFECFRLKQSLQIKATTNKTARALPTPMPAAAPAEIPELFGLCGPGNMLLLGRVIAIKLTLFSASRVKIACDMEKLFRS
jgi:hypothetical protein